MEVVPRLPMLSFELKISPVCPDFATPFKRFISQYYGEDGSIYLKEIIELEILRNNACQAARDFTGCSVLKRYYCQIYSLFNRFGAFENNVGVQCVWADIYSGQTAIGDLDFELACILYNIGAIHAELGASDNRKTPEEMKIACTHFQCAAWAFQHLIEDKKLYRTSDLSNDMMQFFVQIMLAQAQECILEKSILDRRKPGIVAKVTAQVVTYYKSAMLMLQQGAMNTSSQSSIIDVVGLKLFKNWKKFVEFKLFFYDSVCSLYMGNACDEQQKMGERVAWYESADEKIRKASQLSTQLDDITPEISEAISIASDIITTKVILSKKENDFIYHEKVPPIESLTEVKGASLVKGIPFNVCDPEVAGVDIFARLVPIEAHERTSIYSARKDEILRNIRLKIEEKNQELVSYLSSLQLEKETIRAPKEDAIPDELINVCAELSLNPDSVQEVEKTLTQLETISEDTGKIISDSRKSLKDEEEKESEHQTRFGKRPKSMIVVELSKELSKHEETHKKAIESNRSLRENFDQHKEDVIVMTSSSAAKIASILPSNKNVTIDEPIVTEMERLFDKIEEMKKQRIMFEEQLLKEMDQDNVLKLVLAHPKEEIEKIFDDEIKKYDKIINLLEQNLSAQQNILNALTKCNAGYADTRKEIIEVQRNRKTRIASLLYTYQVFKEIQMNSQKGLEFYKKFQSIVTRLNARIRGVNKVQDEERTQFLQSRTKISTDINVDNMPINDILSNPPGMKLKDYLPFMKGMTNENRSSIGSTLSSVNNPIMIPTSSAGTVIGTMLSNQPSSFTPSAPSLTPTPPSVPLVSSNLNIVPISTPNLFPNCQSQQPPLSNPASNSTFSTLSRNNESRIPLSSNQMMYPLPSSSTIMSTGTNSATSQISPYLSYFSVNNSSAINGSNSTFSSIYGPKWDPSKQSQSQNLASQANYFEQGSNLVKNDKIFQHAKQVIPNNNLVSGNYVNVTTSVSSNQQYFASTPVSSLYTNPGQTQSQLALNNFCSQTSHIPQPSMANFMASQVGQSTLLNVNVPKTQMNSSVNASEAIPQMQLISNYYSSLTANSMANVQIPGKVPSPNTYSQGSQQPSVAGYVSYNSGISQPMPQQFGQNHLSAQTLNQPQNSTILPGNMNNCFGVVPHTMTNQQIIPTQLPPLSMTTNQPNTILPYSNNQISNNIPSTGSIVNGHHYPPTTQLPSSTTQSTADDQQNITAILEQESKRGWSVLTPTPVNTVINNNDDIKSENNEQIKNGSNNSEPALPDILSTMLTINGANSESVPNSNNKTIWANKEQKETIKTDTNGSIENTNQQQLPQEFSVKDSEPKDLLSQFDPLFS